MSEVIAQFRTVGLVEAAAILRIHKNTLQERAKSGDIPGAKIGREWTFLESDLADYIRSRYQPTNGPCHSTNKKAAPSGGPASRSLAGPGYVSQLEKLIEQRRKRSKTSAA